MGSINENKGCLFMINNDGSYSEIGKIESATPITINDSEPSDLSNIQYINSFANSEFSFSGKIKLPLRVKLYFLKCSIKEKIRRLIKNG